MKGAIGKNRLMNRRDFLQMSAFALGAYALRSPHTILRATPATQQGFLTGANYPWIGYGHDYGENAWGHDGIITSGWTYQTYSDSQGFTDTRRCTGKAHTGIGSLCITADLKGGDPHRSQGEVYCDLRNHAPRGVSVPVNMENVNAHCWLCLPPGSAGPEGARNGVQLFFKSQDENSDAWHSYYSEWVNIQPSWGGRWIKFTANPSEPAGYKDPQFDPSKVIAIGVKFAINTESTATLAGTIYLDDFRLDTDPPIIFDFELLEADRDFIRLGCSTSIVRVFLFADGRAAPEFGLTGEVADPGFDEYFSEDFDALLEIAERRNVLLIPVLLDFSWCDTPEYVNGVQLGGHSDIIRNATKRQTFLDRALKPLLERYGDNPNIYAWEVINEPEGAMDITGGAWVGDPVTTQQMQDFVQLCAAMVHDYASQLVTVGSARRMWVHYWEGLGLDLYQFHWYDHHASGDSFPWPPCDELGLDKPCIIGEVPTNNTQYSADEFLQAAHEGGYHGLLVWSYRAGDEYSDFSSARPYLERRCNELFLPSISR
jgi:hypothetical protein